ncbi:hypothetical protein [Paraliobacillus ryukyuensis]|uniref:hypothetical protein n=1 Tax=Paraliobacillus ryukyuensis TaxID=200904 RepID=UPI0009A6394F|nr:hypothetical protein [Paraliobacillus ryukyuensis]
MSLKKIFYLFGFIYLGSWLFHFLTHLGYYDSKYLLTGASFVVVSTLLFFGVVYLFYKKGSSNKIVHGLLVLTSLASIVTAVVLA